MGAPMPPAAAGAAWRGRRAAAAAATAAAAPGSDRAAGEAARPVPGGPARRDRAPGEVERGGRSRTAAAGTGVRRVGLGAPPLPSEAAAAAAAGAAGDCVGDGCGGGCVERHCAPGRRSAPPVRQSATVACVRGDARRAGRGPCHHGRRSGGGLAASSMRRAERRGPAGCGCGVRVAASGAAGHYRTSPPLQPHHSVTLRYSSVTA
jgi:hypothetical protein